MDGTAQVNDEAVLQEGQVILEGRYRIVQLLYQRPRLNLYFGRRLFRQEAGKETDDDEEEPLVAIRELVLTALPLPLRAEVEAAAFEEFVSPGVLGSPRLAAGGDRVWFENDRHYLVMQLCNQQNDLYTGALTLDELLLCWKEWPSWLDMKLALNWGIQLCRIVARLHRMGVTLGYLDPTTILVSDIGSATWPPVLLTSWPPPPQFWQSSLADCSERCRQIFPVAGLSTQNAFTAPETLVGEYDERSDIYSMGAILYLLLAHYAPVAAPRRLQAAQQAPLDTYGRESATGIIPPHHTLLEASEGLELIPPHHLYHRIATPLEHVVLCALELDPTARYPSAFALVEALEAVELEESARP